MLKKKLLIFSAVLSLAGLMVNCEGFLEGGMLTNDPNRPSEVPLLAQLVGIQPATYGFIEGDIGIFSVMWVHQMAGVVHQYDGYENYIMTATMFDGAWQQVYEEGGLIDMNEIVVRAEAAGDTTVGAIAKMHEALVMAGAADVWGDIPYSEAAQGLANPTPAYDDQSVVHAAVRALLDDAIDDFEAAELADEFFDGSFDFAFGGDRDAWVEAAHTLKARILLNWAKVTPANYAAALVEAQLGISSTDGNWVAPHSTTLGEENVYWQWDSQRPYGRVGKQIVDMLAGDPRLEFYFEPDDDGNYVGSGHAEGNEDASWLNRETYGAADWDHDMVTWEENQFIIAECQYRAGDEGDALITLNETLTGIEDRWNDVNIEYLDGGTIPRYTGITGTDLLEAIMHEKYKALFLNPQVWNDWKRTGYPALTLGTGFTEAPRRFLYPEDEINTNSDNMPSPLPDLFDRNENDPL